jgi:hypothetical protein
MFSINSTKVGYSSKAHFMTSQVPVEAENSNKNTYSNEIENENDSIKCVKASGLNKNLKNENDEIFNWLYFFLILIFVLIVSGSFCLFVKYVYNK